MYVVDVMQGVSIAIVGSALQSGALHSGSRVGSGVDSGVDSGLSTIWEVGARHSPLQDLYDGKLGDFPNE